MTDRHATSRDRKRAKARYGMRVNNKAARLHEHLVTQRAAAAKAERIAKETTR